MSITITVENIDIPIEESGIDLKASIYCSENTPERAPFIVNVAGLNQHRGSHLEKYFSEQFASRGFYVLAYDHRAHGETKKQTGSSWLKQMKEIFNDINRIISWILRTQEDRLIDGKIALFGRSLGGAMILTHGYDDDRVFKLIALATRYDYHSTTVKFPEDVILKVSPRYVKVKAKNNDSRILVAHCKDDVFIPFENLNLIKEHFGLTDNNVIQYETGGHSFKGHREEIIQIAIDFIGL